MNTTYTCPFCGSNDVTWDMEYNEYECHSCSMIYSDEHIAKENLRHKLSALLVDTSEKHPIGCNITIMENNAETCGLSSNDLPLVTSVFQDSEGIVWFNIYGMSEPVEFDDLEVEDIQTIYDELSK